MKRHDSHEELDPTCGECVQEAATEAFRGSAGSSDMVTCPKCGHKFDPASSAVRFTEATDPKKPYGKVEYADPGYQDDKKQRYPIDTEKHVRAAWSYINKPANQKPYSADQLSKIKAKIRNAAKKLSVSVAEQASEAVVNGNLSFSDIRDAVQAAIQRRLVAATGQAYAWVYVADLTADDVVYCHGDDDLYQCPYSIDQNGAVTLGEPVEVVRTYAPAPAEGPDGDDDDIMQGTFTAPDDDAASATESRDRITGRVVEAKGEDGDGGRIFRVQIIEYGDSDNGRRYPESVLSAAAPLYEGAKAYDHHRTEAELRTSTINGLIGYYRDVESTTRGLEADLHLLPGATHAAEALDATIAAQERGLSPLIGVSHDVMATYRPIVAGGKRLQEATAIVKVNSSDLVADPAAGGQATRMVAGGIEGSGTVPADTKEDAVTPTVEDILGALKEATPAQLASAGLSRASEAKQDDKQDGGERSTEAAHEKTSFMGGLLIRQKVTDAGLPEATVEAVTSALPDRITEADVDNQVAAIKTGLGVAERAGLMPKVGNVQVTKESMEKKKAALDAFFARDFDKGYRSFKEAFADFTGLRPKTFDEDFNRVILRESLGAFDSGFRTTESADSTTWNLVLGDSITRRLVAEYSQPSLQTWRQIVSSIVPANDFRTQRIDRIGGYGTLPAVNQGAPYQPLTTPGNEEVTYAITKRGGTEDITLEMIANDDVRAISRIPVKLGLAAAQTLFRFVWDFLNSNNTIYDGSALFTAGAPHTNLGSTALGQSALSGARASMRKRTAFGDTTDILAIIPRTIVVPSTLEELAWQLSKSAVALPAAAGNPPDSTGAANTPNLHAGIDPIVVDYFDATSPTQWFVVADPNMCPTVELGFYNGRQDPELFTQSDPTVGSMFDSDKITYKIRHIYSGAVLDWRGFHKGNG